MALHATADDRLVVSGPPGRPGGRLVSAQRTEPKTLNWVVAADSGSREVLQRLMADLIHINRQTLTTEAGAGQVLESARPTGCIGNWNCAGEFKFSDGHPFDADDVVFTFQAILDERVTFRRSATCCCWTANRSRSASWTATG